MKRKAIVHVGTHKTGTKSIQLYFARNWDSLRLAGLYQPNAGRHRFTETSATPGHHDLAADLALGDAESLRALADELASENPPSVMISSEEFHPLLAVPDKLRVLRDTLAQSGYEATAVVYLRDQAAYAQSLYAELAKAHNARRFGAYLAEILRDGAFGKASGYVIYFDYEQLVVALAEVFGASNVVVRPYDPTRAGEALIADMLRVVAAIRGAIPLANLSDMDVAVNRRAGFLDVLCDIHAAAERAVPGIAGPQALALRAGAHLDDPRFLEPFSPMSREEHLAFVARFSQSNAALESICGVRIPGSSPDELAPHDDARWIAAAWQRSILDFMTDVWFR